MRVAVIHNSDRSGVINILGPQNREQYNPRTVELVARALERGGHTVRIVEGNMGVIESLEHFMPRVIAGERPGMVFNMAYGIQGVGRYTHLPAMLEMLGVPYIGSGPMAHGLALDKVTAKIMFRNSELPTPNFWNFTSPDDTFEGISFPVIVKPKMEAVSYGLRIVDNWSALREAVATIMEEFQQHVLVEQFIPGREFAVGLLGNGIPEVLPIVEIDLGGNPNAIQSAEEKLHRPLGKVCPAEISDEQRTELKAIARRAFTALDLRDFARVDVRMDTENRPYILEINSMASLGLTGTFVHAAKTAGYSYDSLINKMLDIASVRYFGVSYEETEEEKTITTSAKANLPAKIRTYLRSYATTSEDVLERLVNVYTPTEEVEAVEGLGVWLAGQFRALGFGVQETPRVDVATVRYFRNHDMGTNDVLLLTHLDTAKIENSVRFRIDGNRIYGTGVAQCKGGIAVVLSALRALRFARQLRRVRIGVLVTSDGSANGAAARQAIEEISNSSACVLGLKAGDLDGSVVTSRAGRSHFRLELERRRRSRREFSAQEAITYLCGRAIALQGLNDSDKGIRALITRLSVESEFGVLPQRDQMQFTVRFKSLQQAAEIEDRVRRIARQRTATGLRLSVSGGLRRPPREVGEASNTLYEEILRIARRMNLRVSSHHRWNSADVGYVPPSTPTVDGLGPIGSGERTSEEYILRSSIVERAALLANLILTCRTDHAN